MCCLRFYYSQVVDYEATDDMWLAKILVPEGTENIAVGQPMMVVCDEEEYLAGLADYKVEASDTVATPAATPAAKSPEPKKEEAAPATKEPVATPPASKEPVATPPTTQQKTAASPAVPELVKATAPPAPTPASAVVFAEKWGQGIKKSAISLSLLKKQQAYIDVYGLTGTTPAGPDSSK